MKRSKLLVFFLLIGTIILINGCSNNNNNFEKLITNIHQDGKFIFEDLAWFTDRNEVMESKDLNEEDQQQGRFDSLVKPIKAFDMVEGSIEQKVHYIFSENKKDAQFVSGEYLLHTHDKELFVAFAISLKEYLSESLSEPFANDLSILDQASDISNQIKDVGWEGKDGSMLTISLGTTQNKEEETEYLVIIKTSAPLPDRNSLK